MKHLPVISLFVLLLFLAACKQDVQENSNPERIQIVCTTGMLGDALQNIVTDGAFVYTIMGPGTDPHLYKPTRRDIAKLQAADIIVANGLHLEGKMEEILQKMQGEKLVLFAASGVSKSDLLFPDKGRNIPDPHIWFDVELWRQGLKGIAEKIKASSFAAVLDSAAASAYDSTLQDLDQKVRAQINQIPASRRVLVTAHDAFSYFGKRYGVRIASLQGISTLSGYGLRDIQDLTDLIIERQIPAVFVESSIPKRSIQAVIEGCSARGFPVKLGGTLYSDALGPAGSGAETYTGMVATNAATIATALK